MKALLFLLIVTPLFLRGSRSVPASTPAPAVPAAVIELIRTLEEGKPMLTARVSVEGRPAPGISVSFAVMRTFGAIQLGQDTTLDDGTAAVPFPVTLPGTADGSLNIQATLTAPESFEGQKAMTHMPAGTVAPARERGYPRALWAPHAPFPLIVTLLILLGGVWLTYAIVLTHIYRIAKEVPHA